MAEKSHLGGKRAVEAEDVKTLYRTHQRYFQSARDIVASKMDSRAGAQII